MIFFFSDKTLNVGRRTLNPVSSVFTVVKEQLMRISKSLLCWGKP